MFMELLVDTVVYIAYAPSSETPGAYVGFIKYPYQRQVRAVVCTLPFAENVIPSYEDHRIALKKMRSMYAIITFVGSPPVYSIKRSRWYRSIEECIEERKRRRLELNREFVRLPDIDLSPFVVDPLVHNI